MRDGFRAIISGWMLVDDFDALSDRLEATADWINDGHRPLEDDEQVTIEMMLEAQMRLSGIAAEFLDDDDDENDAEPLDLGPCCMCEGLAGVRNMIMLGHRCVVAGRGWGCLTCGLSTDGAYSVLCDPCMARFREEPSLLTMACRGYPASDGRVAIAVLPPFGHDRAKHAGEEFH